MKINKLISAFLIAMAWLILVFTGTPVNAACPSISGGTGPSTCASDSTAITIDSSQSAAMYCASYYKVYLTMDALALWTNYGYDSTWSNNPPTTFYLGAMPAAGAPTTSGVSSGGGNGGATLCPGTYNVHVSIGMNQGGGYCGGSRCCWHLRLYANSPSTLIIPDTYLGCNFATKSLGSTATATYTWKTSQGPLYPPQIQGDGGSDYGSIVPGNNSYVELLWTGF